MTPIGWVFLALLLPVAMFRARWLPGMVVFAATLQAASVIDVPIGAASFGITPYQVTALAVGVVLLARLLRERSLHGLQPAHPAVWWIAAYAVIAIAGALCLPLLFEGLPVYELLNRHGFDRQMTPLELGLSQFAQAANLGTHLVVLAFLLHDARRSGLTGRSMLCGLAAAVATMLLIGGYERLALTFDWPRSVAFWMNNPGYVQQQRSIVGGLHRISAPFSEVSYGSAFLAAVFLGLLAVWAFGQRSRLALAAAVLVGLGLVNSLGSTGWVAAAIGAVVIFGWLTVAAVRSDARPVTVRRAGVAWAAVIFAAALAAWGWLFSPFSGELRHVVDQAVLSKPNSASAHYRARSNSQALELLIQTRGLGVGLGSNRASSYFASLASNAGLPGLILFLGALWAIMRTYANRAWPTDAGLFVCGCLGGATLAAAIAIPDLNISFYWTFIFLSLIYALPPTATRAAAP